ncbi:MAG: cobyric acid synthase [Butyrivibrio sp.]|nr:cobyric acid synthase [Butyrivibrio sp.]
MAKVIMVQGTMSGAGKSLLVAGLCRIFKQDGYVAVPFKSQNMALNSFITKEGLEMGRAQVMQAECAGVDPLVCMNPILLKPTSDVGSQVIVNGEVIGNMSAREYFAYKKKLVPDILKAFKKLSDMADIIVIEGAGSPAEINLKENDIVNMGMAKMVDAPVLLVGDIDRGGVFAQLYGTTMLLEDEEKERICGFVINKFRGDVTLLDSGIDMITEKTGIKTAGVIPYMNIKVDDEDSLTEKFDAKENSGDLRNAADIAVIRYPRISNFTDFNCFDAHKNASVRYVDSVYDLGDPDIIFLPGSKNTIADLKWLRESGLEACIKRFAMKKPVFGICGGFQMLGRQIVDPSGVESGIGAAIRGMELLDIDTEIREDKVRKQVEDKISFPKGVFENIKDKEILGYEIHMGKTKGDSVSEADRELVVSDGKNVYGSYVHGLFDKGDISRCILEAIGKAGDEKISYSDFKDSQYDILADTIRLNMDMEYVYSCLREVNL